LAKVGLPIPIVLSQRSGGCYYKQQNQQIKGFLVQIVILLLIYFLKQELMKKIINSCFYPPLASYDIIY
jgi:hypothetical protein